MKSNTDTIFAPVNACGEDLSGKLLDLFLGVYDGELSSYYARMAFDAEEDSFVFTDESLDLKGRQDLLARLAQDGGGRWSCDLNLKFYPAKVKPALFVDPAGSPATTVVVSINSGLSDFLLEEERPRVPFLTFIARIALTLGADWFLTGLELDHWKALPRRQVEDKQQWPPLTFAIGWRDKSLDEAQLLRGAGLGPDAVKHSTVGYRFLNLFPAP